MHTGSRGWKTQQLKQAGIKKVDGTKIEKLARQDFNSLYNSFAKGGNLFAR